MAEFNPKKFLHKIVIIDASVLVKAFVEEKGSDMVDEILRMNMKKELSLIAPPLITFEILNVLTRVFKDPKKVREAFKRLQKMEIGLFNLNGKYLNQAIATACDEPKTSYYDASYHALAKDFGATFLTADKKYYDLMKDKRHVELFC